MVRETHPTKNCGGGSRSKAKQSAIVGAGFKPAPTGTTPVSLKTGAYEKLKADC
jgi:hypothetical protein